MMLRPRIQFQNSNRFDDLIGDDSVVCDRLCERVEGTDFGKVEGVTSIYDSAGGKPNR